MIGGFGLRNFWIWVRKKIPKKKLNQTTSLTIGETMSSKSKGLI